MNVRAASTILASLLGTAGLAGFARHTEAQAGVGEWAQRTPWGDLDLQGEWTSEGEYGIPLERPAEYGNRAFLTDEEYAKRLADVQDRDERDLRAAGDDHETLRGERQARTHASAHTRALRAVSI